MFCIKNNYATNVNMCVFFAEINYTLGKGEISLFYNKNKA